MSPCSGEPVGSVRCMVPSPICLGSVSPSPEPDVPYTVALVDLDEGCRMISNIVEVSPEEVRVGMPVEVVFEAITPEISLPKFRPRRNP